MFDVEREAPVIRYIVPSKNRFSIHDSRLISKTGNVVDSRSPDRLGRIPTDQCSPSAGFPARRIHPIRSILIFEVFTAEDAEKAEAT